MESQKHVISVNPTYDRDGVPPLVVDGVPFRGVSGIKVDVSPSDNMSVTVTFHAKEIRMGMAEEA